MELFDSIFFSDVEHEDAISTMKPLLLLLSCVLIARANEIVYKLSGYGQLVTSSTLR